MPYKKKRKTKADVAKEKGLEPLAKQIMSQRVNNLELLAAKYLSDKVTTEEEALQGASDIIAEWINENTYVRRSLRRIFQQKAAVITEVQKDKANEEEAQKIPISIFSGTSHSAKPLHIAYWQSVAR